MYATPTGFGLVGSFLFIQASSQACHFLAEGWATFGTSTPSCAPDLFRRLLLLLLLFLLRLGRQPVVDGERLRSHDLADLRRGADLVSHRVAQYLQILLDH